MAQGRNGVDIGAVYELLTVMSERLDRIDRRLEGHDRRFDSHDRRFDNYDRRFDSHDRKLDQLLEIANEHARTLHDHDRKLDDLSVGLAGLRNTVADYQAVITGHGIGYTELEGRVDRIERHLKLDPAGT